MAQALYDDHPVREYLRVEVGEEEEEKQSFPGIHSSFNRVLFSEELPPFDLAWLAPLFERISETVREERKERRRGEAFAEVFKWRLVSSALLTTTGGAVKSMVSSEHTVAPVPTSEAVFEASLPGLLDGEDDDDDAFYDAHSTVDSVEDVIPLPPVPLLATSLLIVLRFPQVILLVLALSTPFWSSYLSDGRLSRLLWTKTGTSEVIDVDVGYQETLSTLDGLIASYESWEQTTHRAIMFLSTSQFTSYAYSPNPMQSAFPSTSMLTSSPDLAALSQALSSTLRATSTHTSTIRSLLAALARSPREMRMLERMYAPISPASAATAASGWRGSTVDGGRDLRKSRSAMSISASTSWSPLLEEEEEEERSVFEEEDLTVHNSSPSLRQGGRRPLSLASPSPSPSTSNSNSNSSWHSPSQSLTYSPPPSVLLSPPPSRSPPLPSHARPQSLFLHTSGSGHSALHSPSQHHGLPYFHSSSISDIRTYSRSQSQSPSTTNLTLTPRAGQRSMPSSPLTKFTTLPSRVGSPPGGLIGKRGRRRSLSALRPWSAGSTSTSASDSSTYTALPIRPATSPSSSVMTLDPTPSRIHTSLSSHSSQPHSHSYLATRDLEPLMISTDELMEFKKDAKAEIRYTAGCLLGLRFLSSSPVTSGRDWDSQGLKDIWNAVENFFSHVSPSKLELADPEPKRKQSEESFSRRDDAEEEGEDAFDDALDAEIAHDPAYWEDVRSVLGLFKTALEDGVERLKEVFPESMFPPPLNSAPVSPSPTPTPTPSITLVPTPESARPPLDLGLGDVKAEVGRTNELLSFLKNGGGGVKGGFAPMPSQLSRFVRHMEAMQGALLEAQFALRECAQSLASSSIASSTSASASSQDQEAEYERLRCALGVALRECERGRGPLTDHLHGRYGLGLEDAIPEELELEDSDHLRENMPSLVHDDQDEQERSSTESMSMSSPPTYLRDSDALATIVEGNPPVGEGHENGHSHGPTLQQLLEQAILSIPDGREQVFEAQTAAEETAPAYDRKRSTLSREERIKLAKVQKANGEREKKKKKVMGLRPGVDVVQELKDVIWQVGERRRRAGRAAGPPTDG